MDIKLSKNWKPNVGDIIIGHNDVAYMVLSEINGFDRFRLLSIKDNILIKDKYTSIDDIIFKFFNKSIKRYIKSHNVELVEK